MTSKTKLYALRQQTVSLWEARYDEKLKCKRCGLELKPGEMVLSKGRSKYRTSHYHENCAKEVNLL